MGLLTTTWDSTQQTGNITYGAFHWINVAGKWFLVPNFCVPCMTEVGDTILVAVLAWRDYLGRSASWRQELLAST